MPNRLSSTPGQPSFRSSPMVIPQLQLFASATLNGGMVTQIDPVDIAENQVVLALNAGVRYDVLSRRSGFNQFAPIKPNTKSVIALSAFKKFNNTINFLRFTRDTLHVLSAGAWTAIVPAVALTADDTSRIHLVSVNDRAFFGNESDALQEINIGALTCAAAGNAKAYKYYCAFGNRIVGANLAGGAPSGVEIGWSGDFNFTQWDPTVDFSAGFTPLLDSPSDYSDFITGLFGFTSTMLVMRERSIVSAVRQPVASNPFYFTTAVSSIGSDSPNSIAQIPAGLAWYDSRLNNVYAYRIGEASPTPIGDAVRKTIGAQIQDKNKLSGSYDPVHDEYILVIPISSSTVSRVWKYNFKTNAWAYDEIANVASVNALDYQTGSTSIDSLVGTIDALMGFIDDLSPSVTVPAIFYGLTSGEILVVDPSADTDNGIIYTTDIRSKIFKLNPNDGYVTQLHVEYIPQVHGSFQLQYSVDGGNTFKNYKLVSFGIDDVGKRLTIVCNKNVRARTYQWRLLSTSGIFDIVEYSAYAYTTDAFTRGKTT